MSGPRQRYRLGEQGRFLLDPARRELRDGDAPVEVQAKVLDLILCLVERRERAVDKNELQDLVWPRQVITEAAMTRAVMKARRALDDDAESPHMIRTLHGRGYRFVAPVAETLEEEPAAARAAGGDPAPLAGADPPAQAEAAAPASMQAAAIALPPAPAEGRPPAPNSRLWLWSLATLALVAMLLLFAGLLRQRGEPLDPTAIRLAVLPVENLSGSADLDWVRLGLMDTMQQALREASDLALVPAAAVTARPAGESAIATLDALARSHQATHVLRARLEGAVGTLQLQVELIEVARPPRRRMFSGSDPLALARAAVNDLLATVGAHAEVRDADARARVARDPLANEAYVRGRSLILQGREGEALDLLALAHRTDPEAYWPALQYAETLRNLDRFEESAAILRRLAERSAARADRRGELGARIALGILERRLGRFEDAHANLVAALALAEALGLARDAFICLQVLAQIDLTRERHAESGRWLARADALNRERLGGQPDFILLETQGRLALAEGRLVDAEQLLQQALALRQTAGNVLFQGWAWHYLAQVDAAGAGTEARSRAERALELHRKTGNQNAVARSLALAGLLRARTGEVDAAAAALSEAEQSLDADASPLDRALLLEAQAVLAFERGELEAAAATFAAGAKTLAGLQRPRDAARLARHAALAAWAGGDADVGRRLLDGHPDPSSPEAALAIALLGDGEVPAVGGTDGWRWLAQGTRAGRMPVVGLPPPPTLAGPQARSWATGPVR